MRWRIPLVVVLALFVAVSCDQQLVEPAADEVAEAPAFNFMNNPVYGPHIFRWDEQSGWWFENVDGYLIILGMDTADLCGDWSLIEFTSVFTPTDDGGDPWHFGRWIDNWQQKNAPAAIYDYDGAFDCETLQAMDPLATGKGHANGNDNDFAHPNPDEETGNNNANTFGWNFNANMGGYNFNAHWRCVWKRGVEYPNNCNYNQRLN